MALGRSWHDYKQSDRVQYVNFTFYDPEKLEELKALHIPFAWAFHDKDTNIDGEIKKPHYHALVNYGAPTSVKNFQKILADIPANGYAEITGYPRSMYRYLCHEDDPEKYQYDDSVRHCECGFNESDLLSVTDTNFLIRSINHFVIEKNISEYDDLLNELDMEGKLTEYFVVIRNTIHFQHFLKSRRIKRSIEKKKHDDDIQCQQRIRIIEEKKRKIEESKKDENNS